MEYLLFIITLAFYVSIAATEGWKWRKDTGKPDTNSWITYSSYHVWRGVTNLSFIAATVAFLIPSNLGVSASSIAFLVLINVGSWLAYERTMSFVQEDSFLAKRADFHILGRTFPRPAPIVEVAICFASFLGAFACMALG